MPIRYFPPLSDTRWGEIGGAIDDQADLADALAGKADSDHDHDLTLKRISGQRKDKEYYYHQNVKEISRFQSTEGWTGSGIHSADTVNVKIGDESLKVEEDESAASYNVCSLNDISIDLAEFPSGNSSGENDYIMMFFYVSDASAVANIVFTFGADTTYDNANKKKYIIEASSLSSGWNYLKVQKSAFLEDGSVQWNDIRSLRWWWQSNAGALGEYISMQYWGLLRKDPIDMMPNPFQNLNDGVWQREYSIHSGEWFIGEEDSAIVIRNVEPESADLWLMSDRSYEDCYLQAEFDTLENDDSLKLILYGGSQNYVEAGITDSNLITDKVESGNLTNVINENISFTPGDIAGLFLEKKGISITVKLYVNGEFRMLNSFDFNYTGDIYPAITGDAIHNNINQLDNSLFQAGAYISQAGRTWEPQFNWTGGTPSGNITLSGKFYRIGDLVFIRINYSADDSNAVTDLTIDLPLIPGSDNELPILSHEESGGNWSDPLAYIDPAVNSIKFRNFSAGVDGQPLKLSLTAIFGV